MTPDHVDELMISTEWGDGVIATATGDDDVGLPPILLTVLDADSRKVASAAMSIEEAETVVLRLAAVVREARGRA